MLSNYPVGSDTPEAPWNQPDANPEECCDECGAPFEIEESEDEDGWYRGVIVPYETDNGRFCSKECANEEEF